MDRALAELNETLSGEIGQKLRIGIGIHAGPAIVGEMGYGRTTGLTAIGDTVNVASRLCGVSGPGTVAMTAEQWGGLQSELQALREMSVRCSATSLGERSLKGLGQIEVMEVSP